MKYLQKLYEQLCSEQEKTKGIYNYTIPETWNLYGFAKHIPTQQKEIIIDPYAFTRFTIEHILNEKKRPLKTQEWYRESVIYHLIPRLSTAWDHDRTSVIEKKNLYHLNDHGTFLKAILLLPLYRRMGINTIMLTAPFALGKSKQHAFAPLPAVYSFEELDTTLHDPLLGNYPLEDEYRAFEETAHHLGFHMLWQIDMGTMARDNAYIRQHPEWFYWIDKKQLPHMHAPNMPYLSTNCPPDNMVVSLLKTSEDVLLQNEHFRNAPKAGQTLIEIEKQEQLTTVPFMHDRINSTQPVEETYTPFRFYTDTIYTNPAVLRADKYPGQKENSSLWEHLLQSLQHLLAAYDIDGFYFTRTYLLPQKLLRMLIDTVKQKEKAVIIEESNPTSVTGADGISGNSAYIEFDVWNHQLQNFAYRLKEQPMPVFAAAEFLDSPRITQHGNERLSILLHVLNQFLPNSIPLYISGMECMEQQPLLLSYFQEPHYRNALDIHDIRYQKQPLLDDYYFEYRNDGMYKLPHLLERIKKIREVYKDVILNNDTCIPLWFHSSADGIGFAYRKINSALLVIANTNIDKQTTLCIHAAHAFTNMTNIKIKQIFSTEHPFTYDVKTEENGNITMLFEPGEIKFLETEQL